MPKILFKIIFEIYDANFSKEFGMSGISGTSISSTKSSCLYLY